MSSSPSESSNARYSSDSSSKEEDQRDMLETLMEDALAEQRSSLKNLRKKMVETFKERDRITVESREEGLRMYNKAMKDFDEYCKRNPGDVVDPILISVARLEKMVKVSFPELQRCAEAVDPDNAEEEAKEITEKFSRRKRMMNEWRKRIVRKNRDDLQKKKDKIQESLDVKKITEFVNGLMSANALNDDEDKA